MDPATIGNAIETIRREQIAIAEHLRDLRAVLHGQAIREILTADDTAALALADQLARAQAMVFAATENRTHDRTPARQNNADNGPKGGQK